MSDKYEKVVEAAYKLFAVNGFEKTSLAMIAKEVGVSKPAIYYYFSSKEELINELFKIIVQKDHFSNFFQIENYNKENFEERFIQDGIKMIEEQEKDVYYSKIVNEYLSLSIREKKYGESVQQLLNEYVEGFVRILSLGASFGVLAANEIATKAQFLTLIVDGLDKYTGSQFKLENVGIWELSVKGVIRR